MSARRFAALPDDALIGQLRAGIGQAPEPELLAAADTLAHIAGHATGDPIITDHADDLVERRAATFDPTRTYRYTLERHWGDTPPAVFIMLNPSTADAFTEDPTIRRCLAFAKREGCGGLIVVNLFALRATDPKALYKHPDPVGPLNDGIVYEARLQGSPLIAAWGVHGALNGRAQAVRSLMEHADLHCLGTTRDGHPRHPLYVPGNAPLTLYRGAW